MSKKRKNYPASFKKECVQFYNSKNKKIGEVASELGVEYQLLSRWIREDKEHEEKAFPGKGNHIEKELIELQKKLKEVEEERDILKKAMAIFSKQ